MDKDNGSAAPPQWQVFCQLTSKQLVLVTQGLSDELKRRADADTDTQRQHLLYLANVRITEARAYLRNVQSLDARTPSPAPPVPDTQHGAESPGASPLEASTTTGGAGGSAVCSRCLHIEANHLGPHHPRRQCAAGIGTAKWCDCTGFVARADYVCPDCGKSLSTTSFGALRCFNCDDPHPAPSSSSPSELHGRGQPGPKGEAAEGGPAKKGPVDLAAHLSVLKGGAA